MRYLGFVFVLLVFGCKNEGGKGGLLTGKSNVSVLPVEEQLILSNQKNMSDSLVQAFRKEAATILEHRIKASAKSMTGMDKDIWKVDAVLKGMDMTFGENVKGAWVDFGEDHTYKYGNYDVVKGSGRYHFDLEKSTLLMMDDDTRIKPQEFQPILNNDALVLVGAAIYKDNNMQAKFERTASMPVKPVKTPVQ